MNVTSLVTVCRAQTDAEHPTYTQCRHRVLWKRERALRSSGAPFCGYREFGLFLYYCAAVWELAEVESDGVDTSLFNLEIA